MRLNLRPEITFFDRNIMKKIVEDAYDLLETIGFKVESKEVLEILADAGLRVDFKEHRAYANSSIISKCINTAPETFELYSQDRSTYSVVGGSNVQYIADTTQIKFLDMDTNEVRIPTTLDMIKHAYFIEKAKNISVQGGMMVGDVPKEIGDIYRYLLILLNSNKPVHSAVFTHQSFDVFEQMQLAMANNPADVRNKINHIVPANSSSPMAWSEVGCINLMRSAKFGIPAFLVPIPMAGATSPATLLGTLVQTAAENISGVVIHQTIGPGVPIVWGGCPTILDMRTGMSPMSTPETIMLCCASAQIGKYLGLPTATNTGRADSKVIDTQAGIETAMAFTLGAITGINLIRGSGSLAYASTQCLEKLVIDDEIAGMAKRFIQGFSFNEDALAYNQIKEYGISAKGYLETMHTLEWFKEEIFFPTSVIDRTTVSGKYEEFNTILDRSKKKVKDVWNEYEGPILDKNLQKELVQIMETYAKQYGMEKIPLKI